MAAGCAACRRRNLQIVVIVDMAGCTGHVRVAKRQRESCGRVIEDRGIPALRRVAARAIGKRERGTGRRVRRIRRLLPGCQVAARIAAIGWRDLQIIVVVDMAVRARHVRVAVNQEESRSRVIKLGIQESVKTMACFARGREFCARVIGIRCLLIFLQMARGALR